MELSLTCLIIFMIFVGEHYLFSFLIFTVENASSKTNSCASHNVQNEVQDYWCLGYLLKEKITVLYKERFPQPTT